jgi:hypothetical protein
VDDKNDLTLHSLFARDDDRFLGGYKYREWVDSKTEQSPLFRKRIFDFLSFRSDEVAYEKVLGVFREDEFQFHQTYLDVFGKPSTAHKRADPYRFMYDADTCECCGVDLNALNRSGFALCIPCNTSLEDGIEAEDSTSYDLI